MKKISTAVILAAGLGSRLKPITDDFPKCMTEVNGISIIENTLKNLNKFNINETVIVVGYLGEKLINKFGYRYGNVAIKYLWNKDYKTTNSMYSAWIAKEFIKKGAYLIEGDVIFSEQFFEEIQQYSEDKSYWIGMPFEVDGDGSMSISDVNNRIVEVKIVREKLEKYQNNFLKSSGVLKLNKDYGYAFSSWLDQEVKLGNTNIYYDLVIAKNLKNNPLYSINVNNDKWFEIDDVEDLKKAEKIFQPCKYVVVLIDGAADNEIPELDNKTVFEASDITTIDWLASNGKTGLMQTIYKGLPIGSIVANMGILGFVPNRYYPSGRASFEAIAQDIFVGDSDITFRCNLISLDEERKIKDFTSNHISNKDALNIINNILTDHNIELYSGQSYRNTCVVRNIDCMAKDIISNEPHNNIGSKFKDFLLKAKSEKSKDIVNKLNSIMINSIDQIKEINKKYNTSADMLWFWSPSDPPNLPSFEKKYGKRGAIVCGLDFMRGIGLSSGMTSKEIHGATGYLDTNLNEKLKYAKNYLRFNDFVFIHINAADEEAHMKNIKNKVKAIERVENEIVSPLLKYLNDNYNNNFRISILPDHYTRLSDGKHTDDPVPYLLYGKGIKKDLVNIYNEKTIEKNNNKIIKSYDFMDILFKN
tara:strand:+ start:15750 stop:17684 length:1935 start_codon:yes stop_codon:yes gene_type:complete